MTSLVSPLTHFLYEILNKSSRTKKPRGIGGKDEEEKQINRMEKTVSAATVGGGKI